jgi:hypothetical protein
MPFLEYITDTTGPDPAFEKVLEEIAQINQKGSVAIFKNAKEFAKLVLPLFSYINDINAALSDDMYNPSEIQLKKIITMAKALTDALGTCETELAKTLPGKNEFARDMNDALIFTKQLISIFVEPFKSESVILDRGQLQSTDNKVIYELVEDVEDITTGKKGKNTGKDLHGLLIYAMRILEDLKKFNQAQPFDTLEKESAKNWVAGIKAMIKHFEDERKRFNPNFVQVLDRESRAMILLNNKVRFAEESYKSADNKLRT